MYPTSRACTYDQKGEIILAIGSQRLYKRIILYFMLSSYCCFVFLMTARIISYLLLAWGVGRNKRKEAHMLLFWKIWCMGKTKLLWQILKSQKYNITMLEPFVVGVVEWVVALTRSHQQVAIVVIRHFVYVPNSLIMMHETMFNWCVFRTSKCGHVSLCVIPIEQSLQIVAIFF